MSLEGPGYLTSRLRDEGVSRDSKLAQLLPLFNDKYASYLPTDKSIPVLDIGFGEGLFLDFMKTRGHLNCEGIEIDEECFRFCRDRHSVHLTDDSARFLSERKGRYGAIIMRSVIAHIFPKDAVPLLQAVREALLPSGVLLLETFNAALPSAFYTFANDFTHKAAFTEHSLRQILVLSGFKNVQISECSIPAGGWKRSLFRFVRILRTTAMRLDYILERGVGGNPTIYSKSVLAVARRG